MDGLYPYACGQPTQGPNLPVDIDCTWRVECAGPYLPPRWVLGKIAVFAGV